VTTNLEERQLPTFVRANQNVAAMAVLLDTLPVPSTDRVGKVYQQLKNILGTVVAQQVESSLQHRVEASISTLDCSKAGGQCATQEATQIGMTSSPEWFSAHDRLGHLGA
jgi:hypothetical protein